MTILPIKTSGFILLSTVLNLKYSNPKSKSKAIKFTALPRLLRFAIFNLTESNLPTEEKI